MNVMLYDKNFVMQKVFDTYKSLVWADRYSTYGDFELYFAMDPDLLNYVKHDYYLAIDKSEHWMIIEGIKIQTDIEDGNLLVVTGKSLESILSRRIIWGQQTFTGSLQNAIEKMLKDSIISPSDSSRNIPNFIFQKTDDPRITALTIDAQYTGDNLYDVVSGLCEEASIGFKIVLNDSNQFVFSLYAGDDRSYDQVNNPYVVFSPDFDNIINSNYLNSIADYKNITLVAGEGEGNARKTLTVKSKSFQTGLYRRELFTDARDISSNVNGGTLTTAQYNEKLKTRGNDNLKDHKVSTAFEGEVDAVNSFVYGTDFFVGDIVQITNEYSNEGKACISELIFTVEADEVSTYPTFKAIQEEEG